MTCGVLLCNDDAIGTRVAVAYQNEVRAGWLFCHVLLLKQWQLVRLLEPMLYAICAHGFWSVKYVVGIFFQWVIMNGLYHFHGMNFQRVIMNWVIVNGLYHFHGMNSPEYMDPNSFVCWVIPSGCWIGCCIGCC